MTLARMPLMVLLAIGSAASAQELRLSKDGVGPIAISTDISAAKGKAHITASALNESGAAIRYAKIELRAQSKKKCSLFFWTDREWEAGEVFQWDLTVPACKGTPDYAVSILQLDQRSKLYPVHTIYVDEIEGNAGPLTRERIISLAVNSGRFQIVTERAKADAIIAGRAETTGTVTGELSLGTGGVSFSPAVAQATAMAGLTTVTAATQTVVLRVISPGGNLLWAWDDTRSCSQIKIKCAIDDMVRRASHD